MKIKFFMITLFVLSSMGLFSQTRNSRKPSTIGTSEYMRVIPPLSSMQNIISAKNFGHKAPPKRRGANAVVKGKGLPGVGQGDPLVSIQKQSAQRQSVAPVASFDAHIGSVLNDATGAIGPNHYVYAFNSGFGILDREGNVLLPEASLATIFPGESLGDPIVVYDNFADRWVIMQFSNTPNGFLIAVSQGPDPVNDGWYTYRFNTGSFPDYEKLSIWSDGYYITANKDQNNPRANDVVFAVNRDQMLAGQSNAQLIGFPLPDARTSGFYSPGGSHVTGTTLPPVGVGHFILYLQDDAWSGVSSDHIKIWTTDVNWSNPSSSSISQPQELSTTAFDSVFDGGSFQNLDEPGPGPDIDALQATMMYMTNYRRFANHNSIVLNFVVDLSGNDSLAGIRWYELRQSADGQPWTVYQEGTYTQPDGLSAFCGSIGIDSQGNIGLGYTVVSSSVYTSLRYTGRLASDPLGTMTLAEGVSADGDNRNNRSDGRYGDYGQLTVDPLDDLTFWHISEYMRGSGNNRRRSHVVAFKLGDGVDDDEAPSTPTGLVTTNVGATTVSLSWNASTDNIGVSGYDIYQDGAVVTSSGTTSATVTGLSPNTTYSFYVVAKDAAGNQSGNSDTVSATTEDLTGCDGGVGLPYSQSFESGLGNWTQNTGDDLDWSVDAGGTPSNNTGPSSAVDGSNYIYVEASGNGTGYPDKSAILTSPCFDLSGVSTANFSFQYHMFGSSDFGTIDLEISADNGASWTSIWNQSGNQGNAWQSVSLDLSSYIGGSVLLRFNRVTGGTWQADLAIDDINLTSEISSDCESGDITLTITFDNYPQETSWSVTDASGAVIASEQYSTANPDGSTVVEELGTLATGDYTFTISDSYGDGICCQYGSGSYSLSSESGVIVSGGEFSNSESTDFCMSSSSSRRLQTYPLSDLTEDYDDIVKIYPNPTTQILHLKLGDTEVENIKLFSMYGQQVKEFKNPIGKTEINVSDLAVGTYFIRFMTKGISEPITRRFVKE